MESFSIENRRSTLAALSIAMDIYSHDVNANKENIKSVFEATTKIVDEIKILMGTSSAVEDGQKKIEFTKNESKEQETKKETVPTTTKVQEQTKKEESNSKTTAGSHSKEQKQPEKPVVDQKPQTAAKVEKPENAPKEEKKSENVASAQTEAPTTKDSSDANKSTAGSSQKTIERFETEEAAREEMVKVISSYLADNKINDINKVSDTARGSFKDLAQSIYPTSSPLSEKSKEANKLRAKLNTSIIEEVLKGEVSQEKVAGPEAPKQQPTVDEILNKVENLSKEAETKAEKKETVAETDPLKLIASAKDASAAAEIIINQRIAINTGLVAKTKDEQAEFKTQLRNQFAEALKANKNITKNAIESFKAVKEASVKDKNADVYKLFVTRYCFAEAANKLKVAI